MRSHTTCSFAQLTPARYQCSCVCHTRTGRGTGSKMPGQRLNHTLDSSSRTATLPGFEGNGKGSWRASTEKSPRSLACLWTRCVHTDGHHVTPRRPLHDGVHNMRAGGWFCLPSWAAFCIHGCSSCTTTRITKHTRRCTRGVAIFYSHTLYVLSSTYMPSIWHLTHLFMWRLCKCTALHCPCVGRVNAQTFPVATCVRKRHVPPP